MPHHERAQGLASGELPVVVLGAFVASLFNLLSGCALIMAANYAEENERFKSYLILSAGSYVVATAIYVVTHQI